MYIQRLRLFQIFPRGKIFISVAFVSRAEPNREKLLTTKPFLK